MKKVFGEKNINQIQCYLKLVELTQRIAHAKRQLHGIWKSRHETLRYRLSSAIFFSDMRSVCNIYLFIYYFFRLLNG